MSDFYVYVYLRPNGTPCYVGKGRGRRLRCFARAHNPHLANIIRRAGGRLSIVKVRACLTEADAFTIEADLIAAIGRYPNGPLVNMTNGGDGAVSAKRSAETKAKMSAALKCKRNALGYRHTMESRQLMSIALKGKAKSDGQRDKLSAIRKLWWANQVDRSFSESHRANLSASVKRTKAARPRFGHRHSEETKAKMRATAIKRARGRDGQFKPPEISPSTGD